MLSFGTLFLEQRNIFWRHTVRYSLLLLISIFFIFGCGTTRKKWADQNCNEAGGYAFGQKDARSGRNFNTDFLEKCSQENQEMTRKGYLDGYKAAGGKDNPTAEEHKYGQDVLQDVVHAINKNPSKKKPEEKTDESEPKK